MDTKCVVSQSISTINRKVFFMTMDMIKSHQIKCCVKEVTCCETEYLRSDKRNKPNHRIWIILPVY